MDGADDYEYAPLRIPPGTSRSAAATMLSLQVDVGGWDDSSLTEHLEEISATLCAIDAQLSRVADAVRARGFRIAEPLAA